MELGKKVKEAIINSQDEFLDDLASVIEIPSVKGAAEIGAPFGKENRKVLNQVISLAKHYGFQTNIVDNAVGYAQFGEDNDYIGIVGHLDVVAAGSGWSFPPYQLSKENGVLYGRGILDNKGPIMSCLFGLKLLKDLNIPLDKTIRIIFGTNEESGSNDLPLYLDKEQPPIFGFTPDCKYPVVYGERGIVDVIITTGIRKHVLDTISDITGEQGRAFVPDLLTCEIDNRTYKARGKRAPSNAPDLGINAITLLAQEILENSKLDKELADYFRWLSDSFHEKHCGEGINLNLSDEDSGKLMLTPYELVKDETGFKLSVAIRYPISYSESEIIIRLAKKLPQRSQLEIIRSIPGSSFPKDDANVLKLASVYEEITGLDGTPVTTTGATYARFMPNIVAFGPSFPGQKGIAHNADEYMKLGDLLTNMEIYTLAIYRLSSDWKE